MAISFTPGQVISWEDLIAIMAQHGSPGQPKSSKKLDPKPLTDQERAAIIAQGGNPDAPEQTPTYRYYFEDGSYVDARSDPSGREDSPTGAAGTFVVVDYKPSQKFVQAQTATEKPPTQAQQQGIPINEETVVDPATRTTKTTTTFRLPDGSTEDRVSSRPATKAELDALQPDSAKPPTTVATNTTEPFIVERMPDGTLKSTPNPNYKGPEPKAGTNITAKGGDGKTYIIPVDAQGNVGQPRDIGLPPEPKAPNKTVVKDGKTYEQIVDPATGNIIEERLVPTTGGKPLPESATGWTPDPLKPAYGLTERAREIAAMRARGEIDDQQAAQLIAQDRAATELVAQQSTNILQTQGNIRTQDVSLSNAATQFSGNMIERGAQTMLTPAGMNTGGTDSAGKAFLALLNIASQYARANGGLMDRRDPLAPALQQVNQQPLPGTGGAVTINVNTPQPGGGAPPMPPAPEQPAVTRPIFGPPPPIPGQTPVPGGEPAMTSGLFQPPQMGGGAIFEDEDIASVLDDDVRQMPGLGLNLVHSPLTLA